MVYGVIDDNTETDVFLPELVVLCCSKMNCCPMPVAVGIYAIVKLLCYHGMTFLIDLAH